jgi:hypothetical protein
MDLRVIFKCSASSLRNLKIILKERQWGSRIKIKPFLEEVLIVLMVPRMKK